MYSPPIIKLPLSSHIGTPYRELHHIFSTGREPIMALRYVSSRVVIPYRALHHVFSTGREPITALHLSSHPIFLFLSFPSFLFFFVPLHAHSSHDERTYQEDTLRFPHPVHCNNFDYYFFIIIISGGPSWRKTARAAHPTSVPASAVKPSAAHAHAHTRASRSKSRLATEECGHVTFCCRTKTTPSAWKFSALIGRS